MIVLGNSEFAIGMKMAGVKESYSPRNKDEGLEILRKIDQKSFILASASIIEMLPELSQFMNVVSIPDDASAFRSTDDLKSIIKNAVGVDLQM